MTRLFVSDTSILIELERGDLLKQAFALPYQFIVPDLLFKRELKDNGGDALLALGLLVEELDDTQVQAAQDYQSREPGISMPDAFALVLAKGRTEALLTGDQILRRLAESEAVICRGVLWLMDQMLAEGTASAAVLHQSLTAITSHPRCRLPRAETKARLHSWAGGTAAE